MRDIPTGILGVPDYLVGLLFVAAPKQVGFIRGGAQTYVPVALVAWALLYSLFTDYELGLFREPPMQTHLVPDLLKGVFWLPRP